MEAGSSFRVDDDMEAGSSYQVDNDIKEEEIPMRSKLAQMSLQELQELKEKLGTKVFDGTMFGAQQRRSRVRYLDEKEPQIGRRVDKNRPLEMSSKIRLKRFLPTPKATIQKKPKFIDPRFDPLYGDFDPTEFKSNYDFLKVQKVEEIKSLKKEKETETNTKQVGKLDYAIKKMENEIREEERLRKKREREEELHQQTIAALHAGKTPVIYNKTEMRALEIVEKYKRVKKQGIIMKSIGKQRQKIASRTRKKFDEQGLGRS